MLYISTQNVSATFTDWLQLLLIHILRINWIAVGSHTAQCYDGNNCLVCT